MNWKLTLGAIGGYLLISHLRKRGAVTINKDDPAGKVLDDAANTGDKLVEVGAQVKDAVAEKIGAAEPDGTVAVDEEARAAVIGTLY